MLSGQSFPLILIVGRLEDPIFSVKIALAVLNASSAFIFPWQSVVTSFAKIIFASLKKNDSS